MVQPKWGCYKVAEQVARDTIRDGNGCSALKTILNAAAMAHNMGRMREPDPKCL